MMRRGQEGFALITVLWFTALLALVTAIISGWISTALRQASTLNDRVITEARLIDATQRVAYEMSTGYFSMRGLEILSSDALKQAQTNAMIGVIAPTDSPFIALDSRPYRYGAGVIEYQDNKGLYQINGFDRYTFNHVLGYYGVPFDQRDGLLDKLADYLDQSAGQRLNGAKAEDYRRAGRPPPRNEPLITPWETFRVLGWDTYPKLWQGSKPLPMLASIMANARGFNPNTAPVAVLHTLPGVDDEAVNQIVRYRAAQPIANLVQLDQAAGTIIPFDPLSISGFPANSLRIKIVLPHDPLAHVLSIDQTPIAAAPYQVDYEVDLPLTAEDRAVLKRVASLPELPVDAPAQP